MGFSEIILLMAIALILFGPEDLPEIARTVGKIVYEVRKATSELTSSFTDVVQSPRDLMNKAFEETTRVPVVNPNKEDSPESGGEEELLTYDGKLLPDKAEQASPAKAEDNPLSDLPAGMVTYDDKGTSR